jgi:hypothetical protein
MKKQIKSQLWDQHWNQFNCQLRDELRDQLGGQLWDLRRTETSNSSSFVSVSQLRDQLNQDAGGGQ